MRSHHFDEISSFLQVHNRTGTDLACGWEVGYMKAKESDLVTLYVYANCSTISLTLATFSFNSSSVVASAKNLR